MLTAEPDCLHLPLREEFLLACPYWITRVAKRCVEWREEGGWIDLPLLFPV